MLQHNASRRMREFRLGGSVLFMGGTTQAGWKHAVPVERGCTQGCVYLTIR